MTLGQMNSKLIKAQEAETHLDRALLCRALLKDAVDFIYSKAEWVNPKFCVNSNSGANRAKFICGGSRLVRLPPY